MRSRARLDRARSAIAVAAVAAALALEACGGAASPSPTAVATTGPTIPAESAAPTARPTPLPSGPAATPPTSTATAWGTIWDAVPADFPVPQGAEPVDLNEPVSAAWVRGGRRAAIASAMETALQAAGWSIEAASELEDGSVVIDAVRGAPDCRTQVRVEPRGNQVFVIVLYAAACPWG